MSRYHSLNPYCIGCHLLEAACICGDAPRLELATRVVVIMHKTEWGRTSNTGHLIRLGLTNASVHLHGRRGRPLDRAPLGLPGGSPLILYPGRGAEPLTPESAGTMSKPVTFIVPDGNWNQTQHMMRRLPRLTGARTVSLDEPCLDILRSRRNQGATRRSTFEAVARSIGILEGADYEARLLEFFQLMLARKEGRRDMRTIALKAVPAAARQTL